jgi:hypothetical protein
VNSLQLTLYAILSSSKLVLNLAGTHRSFSHISVPRKPECPFCQTELPVLEFEFLSRFFVNLLLEVLQVIVIV